MSDFKLEDFKVNTLILKTPTLTQMSPDLLEIVKEGLLGFLLDMGDLDQDITDENYYGLVRDRFYDEEGERRTLSDSQENMNFIKSETDVFNNALEFVGTALADIVAENKEEIRSFFSVPVCDIYYTPFRAKYNDLLMLVVVSRK